MHDGLQAPTAAVALPSHEALCIAPAPPCGFGLFATRALSRGERLGEYTGEARRYDLWCDEIKARKVAQRGRDDASPFIVEELYAAWAGSGPGDKGVVIDAFSAGNAMRFINCSCHPNCSFKTVAVGFQKHGRLQVVTTRDIDAGEQLSVDYGWYYDPPTLEAVRLEAAKAFNQHLSQLQSLALPTRERLDETVQLISSSLEGGSPEHFLQRFLEPEKLRRCLASGALCEAPGYQDIPDALWPIYEVLGAERVGISCRCALDASLNPLGRCSGIIGRPLQEDFWGRDERAALQRAAKVRQASKSYATLKLAGEKLPERDCRSCRRLLGLGESSDLRKAFLAAAWQHHPDTTKSAKADFAELRRCYERLQRCCGEVAEGPETLTWTPEEQELPAPSQRARSRHVAKGSWDSRRAAGRAQAKQPPQWPQILEVVVDLEIQEPLPRFLWLSAAEQGFGPLSQRGLAFCGAYRRSRDFNASPSYVHARGYHLFWSRMWCDWKIAHQLSERGACTAFVDGSQDAPPWQAFNGDIQALRWDVWDPDADRFAKKRVLVRPL
ncbi:unnamed protein product [Effrenium voratum]|nr:unnamed protein product [Effrenium voratum]